MENSKRRTFRVVSHSDDELRKFCISRTELSPSASAQIEEAEKLFNYIRDGSID